MKYKTLLFDADDTLLDFRESERHALDVTFAQFAPGIGDRIKDVYLDVNDGLWKDYEKGLIPRFDIYRLRFPNTFRACSLPVPGDEIADFYQDKLSEGHFLIPGAVEILEALHGRYTMHIVTNGKKTTQLRRLNDSGLIKYFSNVFISEDMGVQKPSAAFFDMVFNSIGEERSSALIIGDSLSSDIQGGTNAGVDTCWYNPGGKVCPGRQSTFEIHNLTDILKILL